VSTIEFGTRIPNSGPLASPENLVMAARLTEDLGFDSVWVHDHMSWNLEMHRDHVSSGSVDAVRQDQDPDFYESLITLSHVAAVTKRCRLGVAALVLPARNVAHIAKQVSTLDNLSGGRLILVVGLGSPASTGSYEYETAGVPIARRGKRIDEYIAVLRALWAKTGEEEVAFHGEFVNFDNAVLYPNPIQQPMPIWIGGGTVPAAQRAGRLGDGWIPGWMTPQEMKTALAMMRDVAAQHGRDARNMPIGLEVITAITKDRASAFELGASTVKAGLANWERKFENAEDAVEQCLFGNVDDGIRQVEGFMEAGVTHFELRMVYRTMDEFKEQMELWAEKILPRFR
jgi:probable F420-dependent oxidoreductase